MRSGEYPSGRSMRSRYWAAAYWPFWTRRASSSEYTGWSPRISWSMSRVTRSGARSARSTSGRTYAHFSSIQRFMSTGEA